MNKNESFRQMQKAWEQRLAAEGMPAELAMESVEEEHTPAFDTAVSDLYLHYATTASGTHTVHREALGNLRERLRAAGGTSEEVELLSEDFARDVEDRVTSIQHKALEYARQIAKERPSLATRSEVIVKVVTAKLREEEPGVSRSALEELAGRAAMHVLESA